MWGSLARAFCVSQNSVVTLGYTLGLASRHGATQALGRGD